MTGIAGRGEGEQEDRWVKEGVGRKPQSRKEKLGSHTALINQAFLKRSQKPRVRVEQSSQEGLPG